MKLRLYERILLVGLVAVTIACGKDNTTPEPIKLKPSGFTISIPDKGLGYNFAEINWTASTIKDKTGIVYDIYLGEELNGKDVKELKYRFVSLQPNTKYTVKVIAKSIYKTQTVSNYTLTTADTPAPKAISLQETANQPESINVSWTTEDDNLKFDIFLGDKKIAADQVVSNYTFNNLTANTLYRVKIVGKNIHNKTNQAVLNVTTADYNSPADFLVSVKENKPNDVIVEWGRLDPVLTYSVFLNGVLKAERIVDSQYHFRGLTEQTEYTIRIVATNRNSKTTAKEVTVTTPEADAPSDFSIEISNVTRNQARVSWTSTVPYDQNGVDYQVYINNVFKTEIHNNGGFLFEGLNEGTVYEVKIIAVNANQKKLEKTKQFETLAATSLSDFNVSTADISQMGVTLRWTSSVSSDGSPVMYRIYDESDILIARNISDLEYEVTGLQDGTEYTYQVEAYTSTFETLRKVPVTFSTLAHETPSDFTISVSDLTHENATIRWTNSTLSTGEEVFYYVYVGVDLINTTSDNYIQVSLQPSTSYAVRIVAVSPHNTRLEKSVSITTKSEPVYSLECSTGKIETNSISFTWRLDHVDVVYYQLIYNNKSVFKGNLNSFKVSDLISDTEYSFTLLAKSRDGRTYSKDIAVRTKAHPPVINFDLNFHCKGYNQRSFMFRDFFTKNRSQYPDIDNMKVEYYINGTKYESNIAEMIQIPVNDWEPATDYTCRVILKHRDGTVAYDGNHDFTNLENSPPQWNNQLTTISQGFGFVEFTGIQAIDREPNLLVTNYKYFINGVDITNTGYINARGNGQVKRGVNTNGESIIISNLEADTDYEFYIVARDVDGAIATTNKINFRTTSDPVDNFDLSATESTPGVFTFSWDANASISSIKEIRVQLSIDEVPYRSAYVGHSGNVSRSGGKFKINKGLSSILSGKPNAKIKASLIIEWIDNEPIRSVSSRTITIH